MANAREQFFADIAVKLSGKQIAHVRKWIEFRKQFVISPGKPLKSQWESRGDEFTAAQVRSSTHANPGVNPLRQALE